MGLRYDKYNLSGFIEFDNGQIEHGLNNDTQLKRGRDSQRQTNGAVVADSRSLENIETRHKSTHCRCFKN